MKQAAQIFIRWLIITVVFLFVYQVTKGQDKYVTEWEFIRVTKDTTFTQSQARLALIETPNNEDWEVSVSYKKKAQVVITNSFDNIDTQMQYSGTWFNGPTTATGFHNNTIAYSNVPGNSITFNWTGTKIEWLGEFKVGHGRAGITVNNQPEVIVNLGVAGGPKVVFEATLPHGNYQIKIRVVDAKYIVHDGFRTTN